MLLHFLHPSCMRCCTGIPWFCKLIVWFFIADVCPRDYILVCKGGRAGRRLKRSLVRGCCRFCTKERVFALSLRQTSASSASWNALFRLLGFSDLNCVLISSLRFITNLFTAAFSSICKDNFLSIPLLYSDYSAYVSSLKTDLNVWLWTWMV